MELTLEQSFQLAAIAQTIRNCHDVDQLQGMLLEVTRSNMVMQSYYKHLVLDTWELRSNHDHI